MMYTPASAIIGTSTKIKGVRTGIQVINDLAVKEKGLQAEKEKEEMYNDN